MQNYKIIIQYDGTRYNGWQKQGNTPNTIQEKLESIISKMVGTDAEIHGAGRTDKGVHAYAQTANFKIETSMADWEILEYINNYLPNDIDIISIERASHDFHSRLKAKGKKYIYRIQTGNHSNVFERNYLYRIKEMPDTDKMKRAAEKLVGEHDFKGFSSLKHSKKSTVRTIYDIKIETHGNEISIIYYGNGFLYNMIRIITGTLLEIGLEEKNDSIIDTVFETKDRSYAGFTAPSCGLALCEVEY